MNWLNYHHLYYFWTVAKHKSFTKAAEELLIAQSAVSLQVANLEQSLGKKLIIRSTSKKITLTEDGHFVFAQAEEIFRQGRELVEGLKDSGMLSSIRFGALGGLSKNLQIRLLRPILESKEFELSVDVGDSGTLLSRLQSYQLDAILCDTVFPYSEDEPLIQTLVAKEHFCLVAQKDGKRMKVNEALVKHGIYLPAKSNPATIVIENYLKHMKASIPILGYIDDIALLRLLAIETSAVVAIPKIGAQRELQERKLVLLHEFKNLHQNFYLVLRKNGNRSAKILKLLSKA